MPTSSITKKFQIKDDEAMERLIDALEQPKKEHKENHSYEEGKELLKQHYSDKKSDDILKLREQTAEWLQYLPDEALVTVNRLVRMLIRYWDPDYTKLTKEEAERLGEAERQMNNGEFYTEDEVWN